MLKLIVAALLIGCTACVSSDATLVEENAAQPADAVTAVATENEIPALAVATLTADEGMRFQFFGLPEKNGGRTINEDTIFQIASLSKIFTGIVANTLIAEGTLDPDRLVTTYLPDDLSPDAKRNLTGVTVRDVLNHRAGLPRDSAVVNRKDNDPMLVGLSREGLFRDLAIAQMVGQPGAQYEYSNLGYALAGEVLERASGLSYDQLVSRYVIEPYGLGSTFVRSDDVPSGRLAIPYRKEDPLRETQAWQTGKLVAASGIYSTVRDLSKLLQAQIGAYRAQASGKPSPLVLTADTRPVSGTRQYGYGMNSDILNDGGVARQFYYHSGDMDGFAASYLFIPDRSIGVVLLTSRGGSWKDRFQVALLKDLLSRK